MPLALFVAQLFEVTVISTIFSTLTSAPVMVKLFTDVVVLFVVEKNAVELAGDSGLAVTLMVTPAVGIGWVTVTVSGKSGPGAGVSVEFTAGELVKARPVSVHSVLLPLPLLHAGEIATMINNKIPHRARFFINIY